MPMTDLPECRCHDTEEPEDTIERLQSKLKTAKREAFLYRKALGDGCPHGCSGMCPWERRRADAMGPR